MTTKKATTCPLEVAYGGPGPIRYCTRTTLPGRGGKRGATWCAQHLFEWGWITEVEYLAAPAASREDVHS